MTTTAAHSGASPPGQTPSLPSAMWRNLAGRPRAAKLPKGLDAAWNHAFSMTVPMVPRRRMFVQKADAVMALESKFKDLSDARLRQAAHDIRDLFRLGRDTRDDLTRAFAIVREVAWRKLDMRPYKVQVAAAMAMEAGCIAEMATGEGKTLSATMPATIFGWRGRGCHVITVNDYLAQRDAEWMSAVYEFCGLNVSFITGELQAPDRRRAYNADITYTTNKEVAADLLRDRIAMGRQLGLPRVLLSKLFDEGISRADRLVMMRGLEHGIVDEADSVLIDEAVTPLIISGSIPNEQQIEMFKQAAELAEQLEQGAHYQVNHRYREVQLSRAGRERLEELTEEMPGVWAGVRRREEMVNQAVTASELFILDTHYVIQEGKVVIVDEFTGRLMPDRNWRDGLHQAVEAKEGVEVTPPKETLARISFQRFHRMYRHLSGMTGTAIEAQHELWRVYKLPVVRIPTNKACIRDNQGTQIFTRAEDKWQSIVDQIVQVHATGRPILVGTRSVGASELLSEMLTPLGLDHQVLNAVRHKEEAQIIAGAGQPGHITVATNMAGRGTDIKLGRGVADKGGLHVIATERHETGRIDRQLFGRAGRQGDPGSAIAFMSLEDELVQRYAPKLGRNLVRKLAGTSTQLKSRLPQRLAEKAQARATHIAARQRQAVLKSDDWFEEFLGFAGSEG